MTKIFCVRGNGDETSIEKQLEAMRNALKPGDDVAGEFVDNCPSTMARPGLELALSHVREGEVYVIVAASMDRFSRTEEQLRNIQDFLSIKGFQLQIVGVSDATC